MSHTWARLMFSVTAAAIFIAATGLRDGPQAAATGSCDTQTGEINAYELSVFNEINLVRAAHNLPELALSPALSRASAWKSEDSSAGPPNFSHTDSLGRGPSQRARDCGYRYGAGEIIAWGGFANARHLVSEWMASTGHRSHILSNGYSAMGVGEAGNTTRWTVKFGQVADARVPATATPGVATATPTASPEPTATPVATPPPNVAPTPSRTGIPIDLSMGINLVAYGGPHYPVETALGDAWRAVEWVYSWDAAGQSWSRYIVGAPRWVNTLHTLRPGEAYFVGVSEDVSWEQ